MSEKTPGHRNCTVILPTFNHLQGLNPKQYPPDRTHGCWCSFWKRVGHQDLRVWRKGRWLRPKRGEVSWKVRPPHQTPGL